MGDSGNGGTVVPENHPHFSSEKYCCHHRARASFTFLAGKVGEHSHVLVAEA